MIDQDFLKLAVETGNKKAEPYNFGAVIVKSGEVIAAEHNHVHETNDPTEHGEMSAIKVACQKLGTKNLESCILYASHEPCVMCITCAAWVGIERVVYVTPATEQSLRYELKDMTVQDFAAQLPRVIQVEHQELK